MGTKVRNLKHLFTSMAILLTCLKGAPCFLSFAIFTFDHPGAIIISAIIQPGVSTQPQTTGATYIGLKFFLELHVNFYTFMYFQRDARKISLISERIQFHCNK